MNYLIHYGVKGMKWGVRHDRNKTNRVYRQASEKEPKITQDIEKFVNMCGAKMHGLDHRLKTKESIYRKTGLKEINDAVRYTAILSDDKFVKQYNAIKNELLKAGYSETKCKNYFSDYKLGKVSHKSVQCNYRTSDGYIFEIQFQTAASQKAKDKKVPLYEEVRNPHTTQERKNALIIQMRQLADAVDDPPGIDKIKAHGN